MTEEQFNQKIDELTEGLKERVSKKANQLFNSGGVDPEQYEDDFILPKICFVAALRHEAGQWEHPGGDFKEEIENLKHF